MGKESVCGGDTEDTGSIVDLGGTPREGNGNSLKYSCLEKSHGQRRLVAYSPKGHKELDMIEQLSTHTRACVHTHTHKDYLISSFNLYIWNSFRACSLLLTFHSYVERTQSSSF